MQKTFELDEEGDRQLENSKKYKNGISQRKENNFFNATVKKNFFNIQRDIISELKNILKRCQSQKFLGYYPLRSLINGL